jgi:hypothetical protein
LTVSSLRTPAGFVSRRRRSWDCPLRSFLLPRGFRSVSTRENPLTVCRCRYSHRRSGGPAQQGPVSGLQPSRESLAPGDGVNPPDAGCSLGVHPLRVLQRRPWPGFRPTSSPALRGPQRLPATTAGAPEYRSADAPPHLREMQQPFQDSCTSAFPIIRVSAARAMNSPHAASHIPADRPTIFGRAEHPA